MLDFFTIFSKGGIVLWYFQGTSQLFTPSINSLIKTVILQERSGNNSFTHDALTLKYKLDNEFELVFVVAYQKILQLSYIDKFLSDIQLEFRNKYKDDIQNGKLTRNLDFSDVFHSMLRQREEESRVEKVARPMRRFEDSKKSQKTISSMVEKKGDEKKSTKAKGKENKPVKTVTIKEPEVVQVTSPVSNASIDEETLRKNREKFFEKMQGGKKSKSSPKASTPEGKKKGKIGRVWEGAGNSKDVKGLDFSSTNGESIPDDVVPTVAERSLVGSMKGGIRDIEEEEEEEEEEYEEEINKASSSKGSTKSSAKSAGSGMFSMFKNLIGSKTLTKEDLDTALEKMKDHLVAKNVASDIAVKLCDSVAAKLEGRVLGTFNTIAHTVKTTLNESCVQILLPKRRIDILRDAMETKQQKRPYTITFCGVNGVGKSTNLAKICFWLVENGFRVLIAACDTFRAGAVEQLRTHTRKLNALHPNVQQDGQHMVKLYEKGYGKDAAGIAMEAINYARDSHIDVVLVDTAGRMQDNEPLMRALSKLIRVNQPDLVLFVGEALVGNEAVDQLTKFNKALIDHSNSENPRTIDGIILTKFDTIDDKVGAAISMTYTTGQPIVFVGTGQTYTDLRNLNAKAVVSSLLK
ncbi:signal recognition particle receptor subunit alpha-like [Mizuhopecten yessoensis]|uniref:Signal recognition particle receptor subunit alpha n=1 Tax=Mizuhopecten yessoensis TaxID=6573 RepID=A0A210QW44_MIZYE|nr:signal recognition particle receptor subunit alpha-like [Mizuhopecten yessoensis]OWF52945.1 Signal recognition particle receptor subunit alpha [Mizuhopecten yessoensis]